MLLRLLRLGLLSLLFVHQTRPALSIIEDSVEELIVERRTNYYDVFTVNMKTRRTCDAETCSSLGAYHTYLDPGGSSCSCRCEGYQPYTFLSSIQRCANTTQIEDFGGELGIHHININQIALSLCRGHFSKIQHGSCILHADAINGSEVKRFRKLSDEVSGQFSQYNDPK